MTQLSVDQALQLALRHHTAGRWTDAERIYAQIIAQQPRSADALHMHGLLLGQTGRLEQSIKLISQAIAIDPAVPAFYCNLGESYRRLGKLDEAIATLSKSLALNENDPIAHNNLAAALRDKGLLAESIRHCRKALALSPDYADAYNNLGNALRDQFLYADAIDACRKALSLNPDFAEAHNTLGSALQGAGEINSAIEHFQKATQLKPDLITAHSNLGALLRNQRRFEESILAYSAAIQCKPDSPDAYYNLAITLKDMGKLDAAVGAYCKAIELNPDHAESHNNLGNLVRYRGEIDRAIECFSKAIALKPDYAEAFNNLGGAYTDQGRLDDALVLFRQALSLHPDRVNIHSNLVYTIHFHPDYDSAQILQENRQWAAQFEAPLAREIRPHPNDPSPNRILKIGYVSPDFRTHAAACFILPLLASHHRQNVEVYCYATVKRPDAMTQRMRDLNHQWRDVIGLSDSALADQIRQDQIDILIDLTLHMADNRLLTFARKPAPIQITWLGYPSTTGMSTIDYRLTDQYLDPQTANTDAFYTEQSIRLPHSFWCYQPLAQGENVNPLPALLAGHITFGCFNNFAKVTPQTLQLWIKVLRAVEHSHLLIQSQPGRHRDSVLKIFQDHGIAPDRIEFVPKMQPHDYLRLFHRVDLCLDPTPYPGHTSSLDALWMGVPVITLAGQTAPSRGGVSILSTVGLPQFIAHSEQEYISIAEHWSRALIALSRIRANLRPQLAASPLMDAPAFAAGLEAIYRTLWQRWCASPERRNP